ncbi:hypothetical protein LINPERHAP1_LOCUS33892, partial [Linum perenne]
EQWIRCCISPSHFSVLVNGEAKRYFGSQRGLRQRDSISPFLFIMVMKIFSQMMERTKIVVSSKAFLMNESDRTGEVHHLLYADDAMVFCDATTEQVHQVLSVLICLEAVTGLKINAQADFLHYMKRGQCRGLGKHPRLFPWILPCHVPWTSFRFESGQ